MKTPLLTITLICSLIIIAHSMASTDADTVQSEYCPMWEIWHSQKGVPYSERDGWPDANGRYFEECDVSIATDPR